MMSKFAKLRLIAVREILHRVSPIFTDFGASLLGIGVP